MTARTETWAGVPARTRRCRSIAGYSARAPFAFSRPEASCESARPSSYASGSLLTRCGGRRRRAELVRQAPPTLGDTEQRYRTRSLRLAVRKRELALPGRSSLDRSERPNLSSSATHTPSPPQCHPPPTTFLWGPTRAGPPMIGGRARSPQTSPTAVLIGKQQGLFPDSGSGFGPRVDPHAIPLMATCVLRRTAVGRLLDRARCVACDSVSRSGALVRHSFGRQL
jgi:hypothetical protein